MADRPARVHPESPPPAPWIELARAPERTAFVSVESHDGTRTATIAGAGDRAVLIAATEDGGLEVAVIDARGELQSMLGFTGLRERPVHRGAAFVARPSAVRAARLGDGSELPEDARAFGAALTGFVASARIDVRDHRGVLTGWPLRWLDLGSGGIWAALPGPSGPGEDAPARFASLSATDIAAWADLLLERARTATRPR